MPDGHVLRLLDANANRAREGLRVVEDYARFIANDESLTADLKSLRHTLAEITRPWSQGAILWRDTPNDVGTTTKTPTELHREDLPHVVTAAAKRVGEALRAIEEYAKIIDPTAARAAESARYRFYDVEQKITRTLRPATRLDNVRLYVLITESVCTRPWLQAAEEAIQGGADCLQLREKDLEGHELLRRARQVVALCRRHNVISIINDRADVAVLSDADGLHLGQSDLPPSEARKLLGPTKILGVSTHDVTQARQAQLDGADYIGVGPVFRSPTKPRDIAPGLPYARQVAAEITIPAVAIAGITEANVDEVLSTGLRRVAVTAAVIGCTDIRGAAARLKQKLLAAG